MKSIDLKSVARAAEGAADRARAEILPRFRNVSVEWKGDGSPVTEADRAAERAIREHLRSCFPQFGEVLSHFWQLKLQKYAKNQKSLGRK